jgi:carboxypeptidase family protein/TonB-dependent receptor-like protein
LRRFGVPPGVESRFLAVLGMTTYLAFAQLAARAALLLVCPTFAAAQTRTGVVTGRVVARADSQPHNEPHAVAPLAGVTITILGSAATAVSDSGGRFLVNDAPAGRATLRAHLLGYRTADRPIVVVPDDTLRLEIALVSEAIQLPAVETSAAQTDLESFTAKPNVATIQMPAKAMAGVPVIGEPDVIRIVQLLPGVGARNDYTTGLNVRGGSADQNLVLLDGIPIYNPFHMGGLFSTFMDASVGGIELMTGAFPARYDGRLSSVLDVRSDEETRPGVHATADVSVLATTARLASAFGEGRGSWSVAARRTYADALASAFSSDNFPYHFTDLEAHGNYALADGWHFSITGYGGKDVLDLNLASLVGDSTVSRAGNGTWAFDWGNRVVGGAIGRTFRSPVSRWLLGDSAGFEQRVSSSGFSTRLDVGAGSLTQRSAIHDLRAAGSLTAYGAANDRSLGWEVASTHVRYASSAAQSGVTDFDIVQAPMSYAGWIEDLWRVSSRWMIQSGLRGERLTSGREWAALSPRLSIKYLATPTLAFTAAAGRVTQPLHSMAGDSPFQFFDVWLASDPYIPVETAWHYVLGAERRLALSSVRVEGYVKRYDQVLDANPSEDPSRRGDEFLSATGLAYGVDLLARWQAREGRGPSGWLSYSYGLVTHDREGTRWAPGNDRRHDLNIVATWKLARYRLGARFGYATGTPYTPMVGEITRRVYDPANDTWGTGNPAIFIEPLGGAKYSARYPATQRLDLDVSRELFVWGVSVAPYLSVVNAYNARNVFVYIYDFSKDQPTRRGYTQLPILPSLGVRIAF